MDPNANLHESLERARFLIADQVNPQSTIALELADRVLELHEWLRKGGFLPDAWTTPGNENAHRRMSVEYADTTTQTHRTGGVCGHMVGSRTEPGVVLPCALDAGHYGGHSPDTG